jgi:PAS domain S-box-containing protein
VGTLEGLAWKEGARFRKTTNEALKGYINIQGIASDRTGRVFIATRKGVAVTSPPTKGKDVQVSFLPWPASLSQRRSSNVYVVSPDEVWFDCDVAICRWNGKEVRVWNSKAGVPPYRWDLFLKDRAGNLWARNRDSFIKLSPGADRFQTIGPDLPGPIPVPPELAMDSKGRILVTTNHGLAIGGPGGWRRVTEKQGLPANYVTAILQDAEGSMWLGTYGAGLARWAGYDAWRSFTEMEGLASSSITSLLEDPPSGMWVGTAAGLSHGVFSNGTWNWSAISVPGVGLVSTLARSKDGALWMATDGHYVVRYDPAGRTSRRLGPFVDGPFHLRLDGGGRLWIAEAGSIAVARTQPRLENFERIRPPGATPGTLFTATLEDTRGNLWVGSMSGLFRRAQGKWFRYDANSGLRANRILDLALSPEDDLWVTYSEPKGTDRIRVAGETVQIENFDRSKGLTSDRINSIAFDRQGQMWILNDHGAEVRRRDTWVQFSRADGLIHSGSTGRAFWAGADGAIWIGSERGLSRYQPSEAAGPHTETLRVRFSEVRIGDKTFDSGLASFIEADPQTFEAKFSALLLAHGPDVQYRYRFAGFDDRWQETALPEARLDYPPPGRYRLEAQARMGGQPWSGPPVTLALEVRPRWYERPLFRGMLLILACAAVWLIGKLRQRNALAARLTLERKVDQRTAELRESEQRFRNMADTAPVMIWVSGPDRLFTFFNTTWLNFTGSAKTRILGSAWSEGIHPDDLERCVTSYDSAFKTNRNFRTEFRRRRADGEYRWLLCSGVPRFTPGGDFAGYIGSEIDITDVKRAEQEVVVNRALRESEEKYHGIVETMTEGVWILDHDGRTTFVNQQMAAMLGYQVEEMVGRDVLDFKDEEARPIALQKLERRRRGITEQYDSTFLTRDGRRLKVLISTRPLWDGDGRYTGILSIITNITERSLLEEQLHQARKMEAIGRLAGGVAHDFNNLLTVINGYSDLLLQNLDAGGQIHEQLTEIRSAGRRAQELTSQMLAFSRRKIRSTELLSLHTVIKDVEKMLRRMIGEDIELVTAIEPGLGQVKQIALNSLKSC